VSDLSNRSPQEAAQMVGAAWKGEAGRAVIGIDDRAHFHLDLAGVFALTNILVYRLCKDQN